MGIIPTFYDFFTELRKKNCKPDFANCNKKRNFAENFIII